MSIVEKHYSVVAQMEDGTSKVLPVQGQSPAEVFARPRRRPASGAWARERARARGFEN
jgi:hypothetical protein